MLKKQGIIQAKLSHKPSFKNILNIDQARLPSRSHQKKQRKSRSQQKVSSVIIKSPKKLPPRTNEPSQLSQGQSNENKQNNTMPYQSQRLSSNSIKIGSQNSISPNPHQANNSRNQKYEDVNSEISKSYRSKSPKKDSNREAIRQVVLLKNKVLMVDQMIQRSFEEANNICINNNVNETRNKKGKSLVRATSHQDLDFQKQTVKKLKGLQMSLDHHLTEISEICRIKGQDLNKKIEEINNAGASINFQAASMMSNTKVKSRIEPGMPELEAKLQILQKGLA